MTEVAKKRIVRRQTIERIIGRDCLPRTQARRIVLARTGIVIDEMFHYMFRVRDHVAQNIEGDASVRSYERTAIGIFDGSTTLAECGEGKFFDNRDDGGDDGIDFGGVYRATRQQIKNCEFYAGVRQWFTGFLGGYSIGAPALIGKNFAGEIVAVICAYNE